MTHDSTSKMNVNQLLIPLSTVNTKEIGKTIDSCFFFGKGYYWDATATNITKDYAANMQGGAPWRICEEHLWRFGFAWFQRPWSIHRIHWIHWNDRCFWQLCQRQKEARFFMTKLQWCQTLRVRRRFPWVSYIFLIVACHLIWTHNTNTTDTCSDEVYPFIIFKLRTLHFQSHGSKPHQEFWDFQLRQNWEELQSKMLPLKVMGTASPPGSASRALLVLLASNQLGLSLV